MAEQSTPEESQQQVEIAESTGDQPKELEEPQPQFEGAEPVALSKKDKKKNKKAKGKSVVADDALQSAEAGDNLLGSRAEEPTISHTSEQKALAPEGIQTEQDLDRSSDALTTELDSPVLVEAEPAPATMDTSSSLPLDETDQLAAPSESKEGTVDDATEAVSTKKSKKNKKAKKRGSVVEETTPMAEAKSAEEPTVIEEPTSIEVVEVGE